MTCCSHAPACSTFWSGVRRERRHPEEDQVERGDYRIKVDLHVHTVSSGHAYSTVEECARWAAEKGLEAIAVTDHGPAVPG